ncbi:GGDEF domain-containing protein [Pseudoduganella sp. OTU4001]|uniref:GGDEF domain-containing protein n=1 Tax=Pseudoduganella sp. OTU4001 TaxID=3043854 RepID=UPI00313B644F
MQTVLRHKPTKSELTLLFGMAKALMCAVDIESALRAIAEYLAALRLDAILLISNADSGDSCYYLDTPLDSACLELNHRMCRSVRQLVIGGGQGEAAEALALEDGMQVVSPLSSGAGGGYIALSWKAPPAAAMQEHALKLLPLVADLAGVRLNSLLVQLHREEAVHEQYQVFAATQSRHIEELRVSEHEKVAARELAAQDELTGLQNRRGFLSKSEQCLLIARRKGMACAVIFADVDGLKRINDQFGHAAGDRLIRDAATMFKSVFREADVVGRVGGDEFAAFTFDNATPPAIVKRLEERMSLFNVGKEAGCALSLSIGVISCDLFGDVPLSEYLVRADEEMYRHKRLSRDTPN